MITNDFTYHAPTDLAGVASVLSEASGDAVVLGGGTMLIPDMTHGKTRADVVVDLSRAGLSGISHGDGEIVIGAMTTYADVLSDDRATALVPLLRLVAGGVTGGPQIRNKGTIGGSASYANPSSEVPACLLALGARMRLVSASGTREVAAQDFVTGAFATARRPDEALAALVLPVPTGAPVGYTKLKHAEGSWPIATAACVPGPDGALRVALGGVAATPLLVAIDRPEAGVADPAWRAHVREVVDAAVTEPWSDVLSDGAYRRRVAPVAAVRSIAQALETGEEEEPS